MTARIIYPSIIKHRSTADQAAELIYWADVVFIRLEPLPNTWAALMANAETAFYARCYDLGDLEAEFIPSWNAVVAYVRHELSNYHSLLAYAAGKPGADEVYARIKERVNTAVERELKKRYNGSTVL